MRAPRALSGNTVSTSGCGWEYQSCGRRRSNAVHGDQARLIVRPNACRRGSRRCSLHRAAVARRRRSPRPGTLPAKCGRHGSCPDRSRKSGATHPNEWCRRRMAAATLAAGGFYIQQIDGWPKFQPRRTNRSVGRPTVTPAGRRLAFRSAAESAS